MCGVTRPKQTQADIRAEEEAAAERERQAALEAQRVRESEAAAQGRRSLVSSISGSTGVQAVEGGSASLF